MENAHIQPMFCINASKTSSTNTFLNGKTTLKHNMYTNFWNQMIYV
jgi:hypothetical protein